MNEHELRRHLFADHQNDWNQYDRDALKSIFDLGTLEDLHRGAHARQAVRYVTVPLPTVLIDGDAYSVSKGNVVACPECGGPVVWDCGLWHCDEDTSKGMTGHGAFDPWNADRTPLADALNVEV
jgi:hypothetical protein